MALYCLHADAKCAGGFLVALALSQQLQELAFARGQAAIFWISVSATLVAGENNFRNLGSEKGLMLISRADRRDKMLCGFSFQNITARSNLEDLMYQIFVVVSG